MAWVIGADEVGRGCLAGPLCVGAVLVPEEMTSVPGVADSKKLTAAQRNAVMISLTEAKVDMALAFISAEDIDQEGIAPSLRHAFTKAVQSLIAKGNPVSRVLIDGNPMPLELGAVPIEFIVRGDASDWRIGAASIVAKVTRDAIMVEAALKYPGYGWVSNKGYGSQEHQEAIRLNGLTPLHRATFCRKFVREDSVLELFR